MKASATLPLLLELGCEEIPARFLAEAQASLGRNLLGALKEARLVEATSAPPQTFSTPRRLVVRVPKVLARQPDSVEETLGPPIAVALDSQGKPTLAAESFARKNSVRVGELVRVSTPKGDYLALRRKRRGQAAAEMLRELLPRVVARLSFPKNMYWLSKAGPYFIRPIRWMLALLGEGAQAHAIQFEFAGIRAGKSTCGHRGVSQQQVVVSSFKDYLSKLAKSLVEIDPEARRSSILKQCQALLASERQRLVDDPWLLDWVVNSTEWPKPILGCFDNRFLHLPREILITVMRDHQKYFAVEDGKGNLQPRFVAVLNLQADRKGWIRAGHERVLAARFADAEFFWNADQRVPLEDRRELLVGVTYEADLGSYAQKVERMKAIASELCRALEAHGEPCIPYDNIRADDEIPSKRAAQSRVRWVPLVTERVLRAVDLCKCDLTTQMVKEFPELQGIVGGLYARAQGLPPLIHEAIYDHYLPQGIEDRCPRSAIGGVVSLADKLDAVVGGFAVGREPSGSSDPFGLRRAGNAILKVLLELELPIDLRHTVECAAAILDVQWRRPRPEVLGAVWEFLGDRLRYHLETARGLRYDTVRAVLAAGWDVPLDALRRAQGLEATRGSDNFLALSAAARRIKNILAKSASADDWQPGEVDTTCLREDAERELYGAYLAVSSETDALRRTGDYPSALEAIARLRPSVDRFFDKVLVMAEERALRQNRLRLLAKLDGLFSSIAHFAELVTTTAHVDASTLVA